MSLPEANFAGENLLFLKETEKVLRAKKIVSAPVEAEILVLHFSKMNRIDFFTGRKGVSASQKKQIAAAVKKRVSGIPSAYITGLAGFYGQTFQVTPATLVPRPETELLVAAVLESLEKGPSAPKILEIGTGSGCIAVSLTISRPDCRMTALEVSSEALKTARKNARIHGVDRRISLFKSDLFEGLTPRDTGSWDVIVSNPPYIPREELRSLPRDVKREPRLALDGGPGGLELIKKILDEAPVFLKDGGNIFLEIGQGQSAAIERYLKHSPFYRDKKFIRDYAGINRIFTARKTGTADG